MRSRGVLDGEGDSERVELPCGDSTLGPRTANSAPPHASIAEWLRFLVGQGYELADIEQHIVDAVPVNPAPTDGEAADVDE